MGGLFLGIWLASKNQVSSHLVNAQLKVSCMIASQGARSPGHGMGLSHGLQHSSWSYLGRRDGDVMAGLWAMFLYCSTTLSYPFKSGYLGCMISGDSASIIRSMTVICNHED